MLWGASARLGAGTGSGSTPIMRSVPDPDDAGSSTLYAFPVAGFYVDVDVEVLVHEVVVGQPWAEWFAEQVKDVSGRLGFPDLPVRRSTLMDAPAPF